MFFLGGCVCCDPSGTGTGTICPTCGEQSIPKTLQGDWEVYDNSSCDGTGTATGLIDSGSEVLTLQTINGQLGWFSACFSTNGADALLLLTCGPAAWGMNVYRFTTQDCPDDFPQGNGLATTEDSPQCSPFEYVGVPACADAGGGLGEWWHLEATL